MGVINDYDGAMSLEDTATEGVETTSTTQEEVVTEKATENEEN